MMKLGSNDDTRKHVIRLENLFFLKITDGNKKNVLRYSLGQYFEFCSYLSWTILNTSGPVVKIEPNLYPAGRQQHIFSIANLVLTNFLKTVAHRFQCLAQIHQSPSKVVKF